MTNRTAARRGGRVLVRIGLLCVVGLSPLPFGGVRPWSVTAIEIAAALLAAGALWTARRDPRPLTASARRVLLPSVLLLLVGALQLVPAPAGLMSRMAGPSVEVREALGRIVPATRASLVPVSLSPPDTLDALLRLVAYVLIGLTAAVVFRRRRHVRRALAVIACSGAFQALYGSWEYLSGHQRILGYPKEYYLECATGTFVNRNHFAAYLAMTLPVALAALLRPRAPGAAFGWRQRVLRLTRPDNLKAVALGTAGFLILIGIFLSYSRGGLAAALVGVAVLLLAAAPSRRRLATVLAVTVVAVAFLSWRELRAPGERFLAETTEISSLNKRLPLWEAGVRMAPRHLLLGTGLGTFEAAFRVHQPAEIDRRLTHLHNDWLEALIEGGLVLPLLLAWMLAGVWRAARRRLGPGGAPPVAAAAVLAGIAAIAFHSMLDFSLRIPANAVLSSCLAGLAVGAWGEPREGVSSFPGGRPREVTTCG